MWLFTRYGFYSVVCARDPKTNKVDPHTMMVRARVRQHLQNLCNRFAAFEAVEIVESPNHDYRYRISVPKAVWSDVVRHLTEQITYTNFKGCCETSDDVDANYTEMLHDVWQLHYDLQQRSG